MSRKRLQARWQEVFRGIYGKNDMRPHSKHDTPTVIISVSMRNTYILSIPFSRLFEKCRRFLRENTSRLPPKRTMNSIVILVALF